MKKVTLILPLILLSLVGCKPGLELEGTGVKDNPYVISTKEDFISFRDAVNARNYKSNSYFRLDSDIDLGGIEWTPIGTLKRSFDGYFNGNGKTISNFKMTKARNDIGLFDSVSNESKEIPSIEALTVKNFKIIMKDEKINNISGLCGNANGYIKDCNVSGSISVKNVDFNNLGGACGYLAKGEGIISNVDIKTFVRASNGNGKQDFYNIGGVAAFLTESLDSSVNEGSIEVLNLDDVGTKDCIYDSYNTAGVVGSLMGNDGSRGSITNCINNGNVKGQSSVSGIVCNLSSEADCLNLVNNGSLESEGYPSITMGGIVGLSYNGQSKIEACINNGSIKATPLAYKNADGTDNKPQAFIGGISGGGLTHVINCVNHGYISTDGYCNTYVGGISGGINGTMIASYNTGDIQCISDGGSVFAGGLAGVIQDRSNEIKLLNNYSCGEVRGKRIKLEAFTNELIGYLWGYNMFDSNTIMNNYFIQPEITVRDPNLVYASLAYGEESEAENVSGEVIKNNDLIEVEKLKGGVELPYLHKFISKEDVSSNNENAFIFNEGELPRLYFEPSL